MKRLLSLLVLAGGLACAPSPSGDSCSADDDCPGGETCGGGRCQPPAAAPDAGDDDDGGLPSAGDAGDAGDDAGDAGTLPDEGDAGGSPLGCTPNHDGVLREHEVPVVLDVEARYLSAVGDEDAPVPVDVVGTVADDGTRDWRFDAALPGDAELGVVASAVEEHWFASAFEGASYAAPLDANGAVYGVFHRDAERLSLLGVASAEESDDTLITYEPAVDVLRFPLAVGDAFTVTVDADGTFEGNAFYASSDTYEVSVDARGRAHTPAGVFDALRLRVEQTVRVPVPWWPFELVVESIRYSFMSECIGQVAQVVSLEGEDDPQFEGAAEVRRLGLAP